MKGLKHFQPTWRTLLEKMCEKIDVDPETIDFGEDKHWFSDHSWTEQQEAEYKEWFINYLLEDKKRMKDIAAFPALMKTRKNAEKLWGDFLLCYGWRTIHPSI